MKTKLFYLYTVNGDIVNYVRLSEDDFFDPEDFHNDICYDRGYYTKQNRVSRILKDSTISKYKIDNFLHLNPLFESDRIEMIKQIGSTINYHYTRIEELKNHLKTLNNEN